MAAPLAENSSPMVIKSNMMSPKAALLWNLVIAKVNAKDNAAYELAIAFDTRKYLGNLLDGENIRPWKKKSHNNTEEINALPMCLANTFSLDFAVQAVKCTLLFFF